MNRAVRFVIAVIVSCASTFVCAAEGAADYPNRTIRIIDAVVHWSVYRLKVTQMVIPAAVILPAFWRSAAWYQRDFCPL